MMDEEETIFDREGLLGSRDAPSSEKKERKQRLLKTAALSLAFFCLGLCIAIPGPTLMDLGERVNRDTEHMTLIFTARSVGYLIGSLVGGILFDYYDQQILLFYTLALTSVATIGVPWCTALLALSFLICIQGVAIGVLDTGGNVFCIKIWGKKSPPYMQMLHFSFGIGAFLAPLIARPFLVNPYMLLPENTSRGDYHPVSFGVPALNSLSSSHRSIRSLSSLHYDGDGLRDFQDPAVLELAGIPLIDQYRHFSHLLNRLKRQDTNLPQPIDAPDLLAALIDKSTTQGAEGSLINATNETSLSQSHEGTDLIAELDANSTDQGKEWSFINANTTTTVTTTTTTTTPVPKARKPSHISADGLNPIHADGEPNNPILKNINHRVGPVEPEVPPSKTNVESTTSENRTDLNQNGSLVDLTPSGMSSASDQTKQLTTSSVPVTIKMTPTNIISISTTAATTSTTPVPVKTSTSTIVTTTTTLTTTPTSGTTTNLAKVTTKPQEASDVLMNSTSNRTQTMKPETLGDTFSNMLTTITNMSKIQSAYMVIGFLLLANSGFFLFLYWKDRVIHTPLYAHSREDLTRPRDSQCFVISFLALLFVFFLFYVGMEVTFGGLLPTFVVFYPHVVWTHAQGATLAALFWGCLAAGRFVAIFIARFFKPPFMMVTNLSLTVLGALVLSFGIHANADSLWVGTVIIGLGMSSLFPTAISWADTYYPLSGKATAVFITGSGVGEMTIPLLTGYLFEKVDKMAFMYVTLTLSVLLFHLYIALQLIVCKKSKVDQSRSHMGFMRLKTSEEMTDAVDIDMAEISQGSPPRLTENLRRRGTQEEDNKQNGDGHSTSELIKLMELSD